MDNEKLLEAVKIGIKGELDSINIYQTALSGSDDPEVRAFLQSRIEEEKSHYNYLLEYYKKLDQGTNIEDIKVEIDDIEELSPIISAEFVKRIASNQLIFSSLSTAALLEKNAIDFYRRSAAETVNSDLKIFFELLVKWETKHYEDLMDIQKEAEKEYWQINRFEPF